MKKPKEKFYFVKCPACSWMTTGNWKSKMREAYKLHYLDDHLPKLIVKEIKNEH